MYDKKIVSKEKVDATFEGHTYQNELSHCLSYVSYVS